MMGKMSLQKSKLTCLKVFFKSCRKIIIVKITIILLVYPIYCSQFLFNHIYWNNVGLPGVLKEKDRQGRCLLLLTASNWDCSYSLLTIYRAMLLCLDNLTNDLHNQANGFVVIVDWTEFSYKQTAQLKPSILRLMIEGLQVC